MLKNNNLKYIILSFSLIFLFSGLAHSSSPSLYRGKKAYKKVLKKWTEKDKVYQGKNFVAAIHWEVTLLSPDMIKAQSEYYQKIYQTSEDKYNSFDQIKKDAEKYTLFFVSFYSGERKYNELSDPKAGWRIALSDRVDTYDSPIIQKLGKHSLPLHRLFYPYQTNWSQGYYLKFPKIHIDNKLDREINLSIFSPIGNSTLIWQIKK